MRKLYKCVLTFLVFYSVSPINTLAQDELILTTPVAGGVAHSGNLAMTGTFGEFLTSDENIADEQYSLANGFIEAGIIISSPVIEHSAKEFSDLAEAIQVEAEVTDLVQVADVVLHYRRGGEAGFNRISMSEQADDVWAGTIPENMVTNRGVEYYITAANINGGAKRSPETGVYSVRIDVGAPGIQNTTNQPANSYRLVSFPITPSSSSPTSIFSELGNYDDTKWRLWGIESNQSADDSEPYVEFNGSNIQIQRGKAFWLIVKNDGFNLKTGPGITVETNRDFMHPLHSRFNFVANPFNFDIPLSNVRLASGNPLEIFAYNGTGWNQPSSLRPFEGYALLVRADSDHLIIDPDLSPDQDSSGEPTETPEHDWAIQIVATQKDAHDAFNFAGIANGSLTGYDMRDFAEPPVIGNYVSLYFEHTDWQENTTRFSTDVRGDIVNGQIWDFSVETRTSETVDLTFKGLEKIPANERVMLIDESNRVKKELGSANFHSFESYGQGKAQNFKLIIGSQNFVEDYAETYSFIPETFQLEQNYPNPFNPETVIQYGLPETNYVTLKIYNLLGKEVATLVDRLEMQPGFHTAVWDGRNNDGKKMASGIYLYHLRVGNKVLTKKMALIK